MYKLLAIDMDGTLLNNGHNISDKNKQTLKRVKELGVKVALCSGRPINGLDEYKKVLGNLIDYTISYNGGLIEDVNRGEFLHKCFLDYHQVFQLHRLSRQLNVPMHFYDELNLYTTNKNISRYTVIDAYLSNSPLHYCEINDLSKNEKYPKVLFVHDPNELKKVIEKIPSKYYNQFTIVQSEDFFLEFVNKQTNKGKSVQYLAEMLQIDRESVMTFGDNENDISMLQYAGCGVAMENATEEVKANADFQTLSNNEDGIAYALEKLIINRNSF